MEQVNVMGPLDEVVEYWKKNTNKMTETTTRIETQSSFEVGSAGNRHKIHYWTHEELIRKLQEKIELGVLVHEPEWKFPVVDNKMQDMGTPSEIGITTSCGHEG